MLELAEHFELSRCRFQVLVNKHAVASPAVTNPRIPEILSSSQIMALYFPLGSDRDWGRTVDRLETILRGARKAAIAYQSLTGKPLGITGEIAECHAARLLCLKLADARTPGYDAIDEHGRRIQIKGRRVTRNDKTQRVGAIRLEHGWDVAMLVLLDDRFEPVSIHEADRPAIAAALMAPGSKARNIRGALSVSAFKRIAKQVWPVKG